MRCRNRPIPFCANPPPCYSSNREFDFRHFEARRDPDVAYFHDEAHYHDYDYGRGRG
jgi:hypothetical protein